MKILTMVLDMLERLSEEEMEEVEKRILIRKMLLEK